MFRVDVAGVFNGDTDGGDWGVGGVTTAKRTNETGGPHGELERPG